MTEFCDIVNSRRSILGLKGGEEVSMFLAVGKRAADGIRFDRALLPREWTMQTL